MTGHDEDDLDLAQRLADEADAVTFARFQSLDMQVQTKPDMTPVTDVDRAVERLMRGLLIDARPDDAVHGEEYGSSGDADRIWVLDPIDGTKNFIRGVPVWATLVGLLLEGTPVLGVVSAPALGRRWWGVRGRGAHIGGQLVGEPRRLQVSTIASVSDASVSVSDAVGWAGRGMRQGLDRLIERAWRTRAYGDFWSHMLVAEGAVDISAEPDLAPWDMAALVPVIEEAGGRCTALAGSPPLEGGNLLATNGHVHDEVLRLLPD
ncbi:MAG: histidinol-phosphatase [Candidatus Nanopelagicales bacterium]